MSQSLAPEPAPLGHAETDTGPCGLSSFQKDAVQAIIRHCMEARDEHGRMRYHYQVHPDGYNARECLMVATELIGFLGGTLESILEECRRLT